METNELCEYLDWDSQFFCRRIARLTVNRLSQFDLEQIDRWCRSNRIECLYFLADANHRETALLAEDHGFRLSDIRVTLERRLEDGTSIGQEIPPDTVRLATSGDIPALRAIARDNHRDSRFYYDPHFPDALCDALYETWIEKSCKGYADAVLVSGPPGQPLGYISCHIRDGRQGQIGLVGVNAASRNLRIGQALVTKSLQWFAARGVRQVLVVTQGRNCEAQRLYQRCGFLTSSIYLWFHRWYRLREVGD